MFTLDYLLRRAMASLLVIAGVLVLTFFAARIAPSDPARLYAGQRARPQQVEEVRVRLGLDRPLPQQFIHYLAALLAGDWGDSFKTKRSVREDLALFVPATLELLLAGFTLALAIGLPLGVAAGMRAGGVFDRSISILAILGASAPVFALALLLQQLFAGQLHWLPLGGRLDAGVSMAHPVAQYSGFLLLDAAVTGNWLAWRDAAAHLILPAVVVAIYPLCLILRMTRAALASELHAPYIVVARAKGLPTRQIVLHHALRGALLPVLTVSGVAFAYAFTGSILVELLFRWPGVGFYVTDAIVSRDFPVIVAVTLVSTLIFVWVTFAIDVLHHFLDPRTRTGG